MLLAIVTSEQPHHVGECGTELSLVFKDPEEMPTLQGSYKTWAAMAGASLHGHLHSQRAYSLAVECQKSLFREKSVPEDVCLARKTAQLPLPEQVQQPNRAVPWVRNFLSLVLDVPHNDLTGGLPRLYPSRPRIHPERSFPALDGE